MRPGVVGTVLVVLAGGAAVGAVYLRDSGQLERARAGCDAGDRALGEGDAEQARRAYEGALLSATQVGGLSGQLEAALALQDAARRGMQRAAALARASDPGTLPGALAALPGDVAALEPLRAAGGAHWLLEAGLLLEAREADVAALGSPGSVSLPRDAAPDGAVTVLAAAVEAGAGVPGWPRADEAARALARARFTQSVRRCEAAVREGDGERAAQLAREAEAEAGTVGPAFASPEPLARLRERLATVLREVGDRADVEHFRAAVDRLARRVPTNELGTLLPDVEALVPPALRGGHSREDELRARLAQAEARRGRVLSCARDFRGMVLVRRAGETAVFADRTEVTNAAFRLFVEAGGYTRDDLWSEEGLRRRDRFRDESGQSGPKHWRNGAPPAGLDEHPVRGITSFEAEAYARWAGKRLPAVAEWQEAARGADARAYPWGVSWVEGRANVRVPSQPGGDTRPAGSYEGSHGPSGAVDVIGNVRELALAGPGSYVALGGSYDTLPGEATCESSMPVAAVLRASDTGLRCFRDLRWTD